MWMFTWKEISHRASSDYKRQFSKPLMISRFMQVIMYNTALLILTISFGFNPHLNLH